MWFKNLQLYRFTRPFELDADALEKLLEGMAFTPCGSQDISKFGWTTPPAGFTQADEQFWNRDAHRADFPTGAAE